MVQTRRSTTTSSKKTAGRFHGWTLVRAGLIIQVLHSGLVFNAFSLFSVQLQTDFGWSNSTLGGAFALNRAESGLLGPIQGWMTDRFGPRLVIQLGAVIMSLGFVLFSNINSVLGFYLTYLMIALGSSLAGFLTVTVAVVNWFEKKRSRALSISSLGFAVGGVIAFGVGIVLDTYGWRVTARLAAVLVLVILLPASRHFHRRPSDIGQHIDGIDPEEAAAEALTKPAAKPDTGPNAGTVSAVHFTASEAMRTRAFWFISLGHASALLVVGASMAHLAIFLTKETDLADFHASLVIGALPAMMGVGQLIGGVLGDRLNKRLLIVGAMFGHGAGLLVLSVAHGPFLIWVFVVLHGLAWGVRGPLQQAIRADYFGATDFGKIMGFSSLIVMMGMVIGPIVAGVIADQTGSFRLAFAILAVAAGSGSIWFWLAKPPPLPDRTAVEVV